jgi:hypothetical protein
MKCHAQRIDVSDCKDRVCGKLMDQEMSYTKNNFNTEIIRKNKSNVMHREYMFQIIKTECGSLMD